MNLALWTIRSTHRLHEPAPTMGRGPARTTRWSLIQGSVSYLAALAAGAWVISNLEDVPWVVENGWRSLTDLVAPAAALIGVIAASGGSWSGLLTVRDRITFGVGVAVVVVATLATMLWVGPMPALTPLLMGATALVVMRAALVERSSRTVTNRDIVAAPRDRST